jgi:hypothetical protein
VKWWKSTSIAAVSATGLVCTYLGQSCYYLMQVRISPGTFSLQTCLCTGLWSHNSYDVSSSEMSIDVCELECTRLCNDTQLALLLTHLLPRDHTFPVRVIILSANVGVRLMLNFRSQKQDIFGTGTTLVCIFDEYLLCSLNHINVTHEMSCLEALVLVAWIHVSLKTSVEETCCIFSSKSKKLLWTFQEHKL